MSWGGNSYLQRKIKKNRAWDTGEPCSSCCCSVNTIEMIVPDPKSFCLKCYRSVWWRKGQWRWKDKNKYFNISWYVKKSSPPWVTLFYWCPQQSVTRPLLQMALVWGGSLFLWSLGKTASAISWARLSSERGPWGPKNDEFWNRLVKLFN